MEKDLAPARRRQGVEGLTNAGRGELQVSGVDRPAGPFAPHPLGQDLELRVGLGTPASVIDQ